MSYDRAKEIFELCNYNHYLIEESGFCEEYYTYNVPRELEVMWAREKIDSSIEKLRNYEGNDYLKFENELLILRNSFTSFFSKEELIKLYDVIKDKTSKIAMPKSVQLYCLNTFYRIVKTKDINNTPEYIEILKDILMTFEKSKKDGLEFDSKHQRDYDFLHREVDRYISKKH